jgi:transcriptional regulator with XRE-family HTH domain
MAADEVWADLGFALYRRRLEVGIGSQRELSRLSGVNRNTISLIERGKPWSRRGSSWSKLEAALELPTGWIGEFVASRSEAPAPVLTPEAVQEAVLESLAEHAPHLQLRQARSIAAATAKRLGERGFLPGGGSPRR